MEEIRFEPQGQRHRGKMPAPKPDRVVPTRWTEQGKRGPQTGALEVWHTLLEFIEQARRATGLTSDEHLAEALLDALRGAHIPSRRTVRIALAREKAAAGGEPDQDLVSDRTRRRWREESAGAGRKSVNAQELDGLLRE